MSLSVYERENLHRLQYIIYDYGYRLHPVRTGLDCHS